MAALAVVIALVAGWILFKPKHTDTVADKTGDSKAQTQSQTQGNGTNDGGTVAVKKPDTVVVPPVVPKRDLPDTGTDSKPVKIDKEPAKKPDVTPPPVTIPPPVSDTGLVGAWMGSYLDSATQQTTAVTFTFRGTEENLSGTASFTLPDNTAGECSVSGSKYDPAKRVLTLLYTSCKGAKAPAYLHSPTIFGDVDSTAKTLKNGRVLYMATVNAAFAKHGF